MNNRQQLIQIALYGAIGFAAVVGAVVLGYHGTLTSDAVAAILSGALALAGTAAAQTSAVGTAVNGKSVVSSQMLAEQGATYRTGLVAAAASQPNNVTPVEPQTHADSHGDDE